MRQEPVGRRAVTLSAGRGETIHKKRMARLFRVTNVDAARLIIRDGFRDAAAHYGTEMKLKGVWLSDRPFDANEGAKGETVLGAALSVPLFSLADYELIGEGDRLYRE